MSAKDGFGDIPIEEDEEPSVLGASATIEATKAKRTRQRVKRQKPSAAIGADGRIEYVYEPHVAVIPPLRTYFRDLWDRRHFGMELARTEIRGSRSSTTLGSLWALLDPLFMAAIYFFLFTVIRKGGGRGSDFIPLIVGGILLFGITGGAITAGGNSIRSSKNLMLNSTFPRALLPLSTVYKLLLQFLPAIPIIVLALALLNEDGPTSAFTLNMLWLPLVMAIQILTSVGLALAISTLIVFVSDVSNLMQYVSRVLFFSTPIIYPYDILPDSIISYTRWQPLFGIFVSYQKIFLGLRPDFGYLATSAVWSVVLVWFGFWVFLRYERQFASRI